MRQVKFVCDCCGKAINVSVYMLYGAEVDDTESVANGAMFQQFDDVHLCEDCYEDIDAVVMEAITKIRISKNKKVSEPKKETVAIDVPEKKKENKPGPVKGQPVKKIDDGKMLALKNAGWTCEKIADEMGLGVSTVWRHLKNMKEANK